MKPKVSVIIASNREKILCKDSLKRQDYNNFEVVTVRNRIAAEGRNTGVTKSKGNIIAFLDDDTKVPSNWISTGVSLLKKTNADIVGGPNVSLPNAPLSERISDHLLSSFLFSGLRKKFKKGSPGISSYKNFATCNLFLKRKVFKDVGGFNTNFRYAEDMEFLFICEKGGYRFYYSPDLYVFHARRKFPFAHIKQLFFWGLGNSQLASAYPELFKRIDNLMVFFLIPTGLALLYYFPHMMIPLLLIFSIYVIHFLSYAIGLLAGIPIFFKYKKFRRRF